MATPSHHLPFERPIFELEQKLALSDMVAKGENRLSRPLYALNQRLGASLRLNRRTFVDFAVMEDEFNPDVSPDVGFHIRVRRLGPAVRSP